MKLKKKIQTGEYPGKRCFDNMINLKKTFIIAEIGMNHDGSFGQAKALVKAAADSGVDAVKFQMHIFDAESLPDAPAPPYFTDETRREFFNRTAFTPKQWAAIKDYCEECNVNFVCSPFSIEAVELLESIGTEIYKIPSGEVTNVPYLEKLAQTGRTIILSSGMSNFEELDLAVKTISKWNSDLIILQCSSRYPCSYEDVGMNVLEEMKSRYDLPVGLSDHTLTIFASLHAVGRGACVIERHFTISRMMYGPDARFSLEPEDMKRLCDGIRATEIILQSNVDKNDIADFSRMKMIFEKSIVSKNQIKSGELITPSNITTKKPGNGIPATQYHEILGKKVIRDIPANVMIKWDDIL
jgi:sialic acid synthase SpsE